jgi:hypothetical protein
MTIMQVRGKIYEDWAATEADEEVHGEGLENGCFIDVRARETPLGSVQVLVCVYASDGSAVYEHVSTLETKEWTIHDALQRGVDQAERIAGGEAGRLPCADAGRPPVRK